MNPAGRPNPSDPAIRPAFTLVEVMVVALMLAVVAAVIAPRLFVRADNMERQELRRTADLLGAAASRAALSAQPVALAFDADTASLRVLIQSREEPSRRGRSSPWTPDPVLAPLALTSLRIDAVHADGRRLDPRAWMVELGATIAPTGLSILVQSRRDDRRWLLTLDPVAQAVAITDGARPEPDPRRVDLDAAGLRDQPW